MPSLPKPSMTVSRLVLPVLLLACVASAPVRVIADPPTPGLSPAIQAVLDDIRKADTGQLAVSPEDGRFLRVLVDVDRRKRALEIGAARATARSGSASACAKPAAAWSTIEYDPARAKEAAANVEARRARRHRHGGRRRRVQGDSEARRHSSTSSSSTPGSATTASSSTWSSRGSTPAGSSSRTTSSTRERDERLPRRIDDPPRPVHADRRSGRRRRVGLLQATGYGHDASRSTSSAFRSTSAAAGAASTWGRRRSASPASASG